MLELSSTRTNKASTLIDPLHLLQKLKFVFISAFIWFHHLSISVFPKDPFAKDWILLLYWADIALLSQRILLHLISLTIAALLWVYLKSLLCLFLHSPYLLTWHLLSFSVAPEGLTASYFLCWRASGTSPSNLFLFFSSESLIKSFMTAIGKQFWALLSLHRCTSNFAEDRV